jgi:hemolysin activation/secretion protein
VLLSALLATGAMAQVVPPEVNPANIERRFEQPPPAPLPSTNLQAITPPAPAPLSPEMRAKLEQTRFVLSNVVIEGATAYPPETLRAIYEEFRGKEISLLDVQTITQRITDLYHRDGYVLSQAILPPQDIKGGVVTIRVIEGYVSNVTFQGDRDGNNLRNLLGSFGDNIKEVRPIDIATLERYLLLLNDLPGVVAKGVLRPSALATGAAELVVTITQKKFDASYTLDNRGTKYVGPWEHTATFAVNSLFGMYDRTQVRLMTTSPTTELHYIDIQHQEPIDADGTLLVIDASHSLTNPGDSLRPLGIEGDSDFLQVKILHPFIRSRTEDITGRLMIDTRNTDTELFKDEPFTNDRIRSVRAGANMDFLDGWSGLNVIDGQASHGLNIFDASGSGPDRSNPFGASNYTKLNMDISRTQPLPYDFSLFAAASGQHAFEPLLSAEQFTLGGVGFGQAYDQAEVSGDDGLAGKLELRYSQAVGDPYLAAYQLYGYYDIGRVWEIDNTPGTNDKKSLASLGMGVRTTFTDNVMGSLELAIPMTAPITSEGPRDYGPRIFVSLTAKY